MSGRSARRAGALAALTLLLLLAVAPVAGAQTEEWAIRSFEADITVAEDGSLEITETIDVDFHVPSRGIFREIPYRYPVDDGTLRYFRFDRVDVETTGDAPDDLHRETAGDYLVWRIGDPETYVTGPYTYTLSYRVRGALNRFDDHDELFWNVTGDRWEVPIEQASATVRAPAVSDARCFAGATGADEPCAEASHAAGSARFTAGTLQPRTQLDVVVALPPGTVDVPEPDLRPANVLARVFQVDPLRTGGAVLVGLAGLAGVGALARRGRDERAEVAGERLPGGVEYRPPDDLRPAQLRTLLDQRVDDVSLSSTLVDLAVRGHVRIEELEAGMLDRLRRRDDWIIHRQPTVPDDLEPYEETVLRGLFGAQTLADPERGQTAVQVSSLSDGSFHKHYKRATDELYADVVRRGFFRRDPSAVRTVFALLAGVVLVAGVAGIIGMLVQDWTYGLVLTPLPVVGLLLLLFSRWAPRRTARGAAMNERAQGFREFVRTAEADRMDFAEREQLFVAYLPYAMAFDCVDRWVQAFERMGVPAATAAGTWYVGRGRFDTRRMTSSMSSLSSQVGGTMRQTPASKGKSGFSGGGSSGGGGGGGGGGRW